MKLIRIGITILVFVGGILSGFFIRNFPLINWNKEVKIYEVAQVCATLFVGLVIPFLIKKWIEDNRFVKNSLIEECKESLLQVKKIKDKIDICFTKGSISPSDKDEILLLFNDCDFKIDNLAENIELAFRKKRNPIISKIKQEYVTYWKIVTGGSLMASSYIKIDELFCRNEKYQFAEFEKSIRQSIILIQRM